MIQYQETQFQLTTVVLATKLTTTVIQVFYSWSHDTDLMCLFIFKKDIYSTFKAYMNRLHVYIIKNNLHNKLHVYTQCKL